MRNKAEIMLLAKRIRLVMEQKASVSLYYNTVEKLVDLILENEGDNANSAN